MKKSNAVRGLTIAFCMALVFAGLYVQAQTAPSKAQTKPFEPSVGQAGKDVVWVPTPQALVDKMLDMAKVTAQDFVMDLGSGDGRTVITAAKRGARALGVEYNPDMVELSKANAAKAGVTDRAQFVKADLFETDFSKATVITMFLLPDINLRLRPKLLDLKPGTRIVSNSFTMEEWNADETATVEEGCSSWCTALFWIVPAKVDGKWRSKEGDLALTQSFQMLSGSLTSNGKSVPIADGKMNGTQITFSVGGVVHSGQVKGNVIEGTTKAAGRSEAWSANRIEN
jgi:precorrin-6B methylase 2